MSKRPIINIPDPVLRKVAAPIERVDAEVLRLADDMLESMYAAPGIGLAAPQVGVSRRLIVMDTGGDRAKPKPLIMINPQIMQLGPTTEAHEEGCLSIPDVKVEVERPTTLTVQFVDRSGKTQEMAVEGLMATVVQHEIDHLDGRLIIDYLSRLKRDIIVRRFRKQARIELSD